MPAPASQLDRVTMVVLLMGFAFWNGLSRYWSSLVEWLRALLTA